MVTKRRWFRMFHKGWYWEEQAGQGHVVVASRACGGSVDLCLVRQESGHG